MLRILNDIINKTPYGVTFSPDGDIREVYFFEALATDIKDNIKGLADLLRYKPKICLTLEDGDEVGYGIRYYDLFDIIELLRCPAITNIWNAETGELYIRRLNLQPIYQEF